MGNPIEDGAEYLGSVGAVIIGLAIVGGIALGGWELMKLIGRVLTPG